MPRSNLVARWAVALACALAVGGAAAQSAPKITKKIAPEFPGDAVRKGIDRGVLKVRLTVDGAGVPTEVSVIDVQPAKAKMLNDPVAEALKAWRFEGAGKPATFELQIVMTSE